MVPGASHIASPKQGALRSYLNSKAEESKDAVKLSPLESLEKHEQRLDMVYRNIQSRMGNLFISYRNILRRNGVGWIIK